MVHFIDLAGYEPPTCPECKTRITPDDLACPGCGLSLTIQIPPPTWRFWVWNFFQVIKEVVTLQYFKKRDDTEFKEKIKQILDEYENLH
ncbi:MAG TPA: hypothetical protein VHB70_18965 [Parafilimonas sp.]|nr:hypothetical protein [Parafilimonas sp.]